MKGKHLLNALWGTVFGLWTAAGSVGCLVTAFGLPLAHPEQLLFGGFLFAAFCAGLYQWKRGGLVLLCLAALGAGYLWRLGFPAEPFLSLLSRLTEVYDRAYGWGVFPAQETALDIPMALAGGIMILLVTRAVCRGTGAALPSLTAVLLFTPCIVVTDTVPDIPFLFLLGTGLALLALTAGVRKTASFQGDRLAAMAAVPVLLAAGLLLWLNPQEGYVSRVRELQQAMVDWTARLPSLLENTSAALSGGGDPGRQVSLSALGRRIERKVTVMEVTSQTGGVLYLRGRDYDSYDGFGWTSTQNRAETFGLSQEATNAIVLRTRSREGLLYLPYYPAELLSLTGGTAPNSGDLTEYAFSVTGPPPRPIVPQEETVSFGMATPEDAALWEQLRRYLTLPIEAEAGLRAVLSAINLSGTSEEKANAIADYVRGSAKYDLDPSRMPSDAADFACWFLKDGERGYCVHFATAATVLLRAADIPARYVTGYMVTAEPGEAVKVTGEHAHAWAEYYDAALGCWMVLEATPPEESAGETEPSAGTEGTKPTQTAPTLPRPTEPERPGQTLPAPSVPTEPGKDGAPDLSWLRALAKGALGLAVLAVLLESQRKLRLYLRHRGRETPNATALARWREAALLAKLLGEEPPRELHRLAQKAKFSQHTLTVQELNLFDTHLRTARRRLQERPWYVRLAHRYIFAAY